MNFIYKGQAYVWNIWCWQTNLLYEAYLVLLVFSWVFFFSFSCDFYYAYLFYPIWSHDVLCVCTSVVRICLTYETGVRRYRTKGGLWLSLGNKIQISVIFCWHFSFSYAFFIIFFGFQPSSWFSWFHISMSKLHDSTNNGIHRISSCKINQSWEFEIATLLRFAIIIWNRIIADAGIGVTNELTDYLGTETQDGASWFLKVLKDNKNFRVDNVLVNWVLAYFHWGRQWRDSCWVLGSKYELNSNLTKIRKKEYFIWKFATLITKLKCIEKKEIKKNDYYVWSEDDAHTLQVLWLVRHEKAV